MAKKTAAAKRKAKSLKKVAELIESGKAKQTVADLSKKTLEGLGNRSGKMSESAKRLTAHALAETARRPTSGARPTARSRRKRRGKG